MLQDDLTIALYGIYGVYNYGCEAIIRGTEIILHNIWPDLNIKYISPRVKDDKKRLKGCDLDILPRKKHHLVSIQSLNNISAYYTGFYSKKFYSEYTDWIGDCDAVFSIGGDMYTLPYNYNESKYRKYYNPLIHLGDIVKEKQKKFIIWGASIGPFENNPQTKKIFINHLKNVDLIVSREQMTTSYLNNLKIKKNVIECPDPAFFVPIAQDISLNTFSDIDKIRIGINFSPLSIIYGVGKSNQDKFFKEIINIITTLVRELDAEILLLPHVICDFNINDDDQRYLMSIKDNLHPDIAKYVKIVDNDPGFIGIKDKMLTCDIVIASRMHCAINSITLEIPTIFISYSQKSIGMVKFIYGNEDWILTLNQMNSKVLLNMVEFMLKKSKTIKSNLNYFMGNVNSDSYLNLKNKLW